jgi:hypothetical protein
LPARIISAGARFQGPTPLAQQENGRDCASDLTKYQGAGTVRLVSQLSFSATYHAKPKYLFQSPYGHTSTSLVAGEHGVGHILQLSLENTRLLFLLCVHPNHAQESTASSILPAIKDEGGAQEAWIRRKLKKPDLRAQAV